MNINADNLQEASIQDLLDAYVVRLNAARQMADWHPEGSTLAREQAEAIAAEIKARSVR